MALDEKEIEALRTDSSRLRLLRDYFKSEGYTLAGIARLVEEEDPMALLRNGVLSALMYGEQLENDATPLAVLAQLFLLGGRIDRRIYEVAIPAKIREVLDQHALARQVDDRFESQVTIVEFESFYFVSDKLFENRGKGNIQVQAMPNAVWPMSDWSLSLYLGLRRDPRWQSFLDVGSGSGCLSLLVHKRYSRTVGIDLNPRAVAFSILNAALNDARGVSYEVADCFEYEDAARYDHIGFAAPGGPGFETIGASMVSYGGKLGHELVLRFLSERAEHLMSPTGCCQAWGVFVVQELHGSLQKLLEHSLPTARLFFTAEPLKHSGLYISPEEIARNKLSWNCHYARGAAQAPFLEQLKRNQVREVVPALLTLRPRRS